MSTYVSVNGNPDDLIGSGARLKGSAASLKAQAQTLLSDISSIDGGEPWGHDDPGQQFAQQYNQTPQGGGDPFSQTLKDALQKAGDQLDKVGDGVIQAMAGYQGADTVNKGDIASTGK